MSSKNNQSAVQTMLHAFQAQGATVAENSFFGIPVRAYFGEPVVNESPVAAPSAPWQANRALSGQMMAEFEAMGARQTDPTFFGVPVAEYLGRVEKGIWQKIVEDLAAMTPAAQPVN
ncbi:MAG: hypothetical protein CL608_32290 [Anaerolineaceae bacterium]|nr:hypothetical protein [Anaerolineaceae bacterium]